MDKQFILTEEKRALIKDFLKNHLTSKAIIALNNLEEIKEDEFLIKIKSLMRNQGKSNVISTSVINNLVEEFENAKSNKD